MANEKIEFICLGSSSSGNSYAFRKGSDVVLVECGFDFKVLISKLMDHDICLSDVRALVVTHQHSDHNKSTQHFVQRGIPCFVTSGCVGGTLQSYDNVHILTDGAKLDIVPWLRAVAFKVEHDKDIDAFGFAFLDVETCESILFINDTRCFDFKYKNMRFDYIFIECNHIRKQLEAMMQAALDNHKPGEVYKFKRQASCHLSLAGCKKFLSLMPHLSSTKGIFLMHLSKDCCNDRVVKEEINHEFGIPTFVCYRGGGIS